MTRYILGMITLLVLTGCQATSTEQFPNLAITEGELLSNKWAGLQRFPPMYPMEEAQAGIEGCATVEYVISPDHDITDIKVVAATNASFAHQAKVNISRWKWSELPQDILQNPVKTRTQFQYCLETGDRHCSSPSLLANSECSGSDVIYSVGHRMQ